MHFRGQSTHYHLKTGCLGLDLNDTYTYVLFSLHNPQLGVLRTFWHKVWRA